jgi:hypothetical protein
MSCTRRALAFLFPALAAAQQQSQPRAQSGTLPSKAYPFASNDLHGYRNPGTTAAKYFVFALGNDQLLAA